MSDLKTIVLIWRSLMWADKLTLIIWKCTNTNLEELDKIHTYARTSTWMRGTAHVQEHKQIKDGNIGIEGKPIEFEWNIFPSTMFSFSEFHNS